MAMKRMTCEKYASVELNQVAFPDDRRVVSQVPAGAEYTENAPMENGMWVSINKADGTIHSINAVTDPIGIVYTSEKEWNDSSRIGLKNHYKVAGDYPRVGVLSVNDTVTSNCFQYDNTEFSNEANLFAALANCATTKVYVGAVANSSVAKLTATKPSTGAFGEVVKFYTMPNGEKGVKYQMIRV